MGKFKYFYNPRHRQIAGHLRIALIRDQHNMLRNILPALYATMMVTLIVFTITFKDTLPQWYGLYLPLGFLGFMAIRTNYWIKSFRSGPEPDINIIQKDIKSVSWLAPLMILCYSSLAIFSQLGQGDHHLTLAIVVVWCVALVTAFSLSTMPLTSIFVIMFATIPVSISFALHGTSNMTPLVSIFISLSLLVIYTNSVTYRTFVEAIITRCKLSKKNAIIENEREFATKIAYTDNLTGLPNRRSFYDKLDEKLIQLENGETEPFSVAIIDLDGFKPINDVHGHQTGDAVLIEVGKRLISAIKNSGMVARLGGDEFCVLVNDIVTEEDATLLGDHLVEALRPAYNIDAVKAHLSGSCGIYLVNKEGANSSCVMERADLALYKAKSENRGYTEIFSSEMEENVRKRSQVEQALREAIANNSIDIHFQPIVDLRDKKIVGMEALARWHHAELGDISPDWFIPIAEHSGLIAELTENLFRKAITTAKKWPEEYFLSFNLSAENLTRPTVGMNILSIMLQENFNPTRLEIEVTETAIMRNLQRARATIINLRKAQIKISLDDFGTGYSSMSQIKELPFDKIKIDKSFIDGICDSQRTRSLVLSVVGMCKNLNICCLAEGIETEEQRIILSNMGCKLGQGYLFGKPVSSAKSIQLLTQSAPENARMSA